MTNLTEKLELMQRLHGRGIRPALWLCRESGTELLVPTSEVDQGYWEPIQGWYPLEQVLELLPTRIIVEEGYKHKTLVMQHDAYYYVEPFKTATEAGLVRVDGDHHLAALKLLVSTKKMS